MSLPARYQTCWESAVGGMGGGGGDLMEGIVPSVGGSIARGGGRGSPTFFSLGIELHLYGLGTDWELQLPRTTPHSVLAKDCRWLISKF